MTINRRRWFDWHSWAGFKLWLLLSFVLVTGAFATVSLEIDWLFNPDMRNFQAAPERLDWGAMLDNGRAAFPHARLTMINAPPASFVNAEAIAINPGGERFRIFFDPSTSEVAGAGRWQNWQRFFRQTHRHLMLPIRVGVTIVGLLSIPLLVSFATSFVIYKRWWRGFGKVPGRRKRGQANNPVKRSHRYWGDMHRWLGVWSLWFILLMALTGLWYLLEQWGLDARHQPLPKVEAAAEEVLSGNALNGFVDRAARIYPELDIKRVLLAQQDGAVLLLQGQAVAVLVRPRANQLAFDLASGELINHRRGEDLGLHLRIHEAADPLHFGTLGGTPTRYTWFLFGVMLSALSISGAYICGLRVIRSFPGAGIKLPGAAWRAGWQRLERIARWPTLALVCMTLVVAAYYFIGSP